ncbi:MAG: hypothetical protein ACXWC0_15145, partial [Burkholderiales bacterium]
MRLTGYFDRYASDEAQAASRRAAHALGAVDEIELPEAHRARAAAFTWHTGRQRPDFASGILKVQTPFTLQKVYVPRLCRSRASASIRASRQVRFASV